MFREIGQICIKRAEFTEDGVKYTNDAVNCSGKDLEYMPESHT
jgi:hypothetical protein